ncbi:HAD-IA family hydrolase [Roseibium album]|uniref:HAD-IA family hydrolase n=1 Tax=Roseibium album TaxID=311410 RepID=UPI00248F9E70|nr:HAD-IA family hydrolase [Roseibium album]
MRKNTKAIAWDFDGVLNRNVIGGKFVWSETLEEDLGIPLKDFQEGIFNRTFMQVISGKTDLKDHVRDWLCRQDHPHTADAILTYWFAKDDLQDPLTCGLVERLRLTGIRQVVATNNEHHRTTYIERISGFSDRVDRVFSSGRIGHAKPDAAFFQHVSTSLDLPPEDMLLIDDSSANIAAARSLGWDGFHFTEETRTELASFLGL